MILRKQKSNPLHFPGFHGSQGRWRPLSLARTSGGLPSGDVPAPRRFFGSLGDEALSGRGKKGSVDLGGRLSPGEGI